MNRFNHLSNDAFRGKAEEALGQLVPLFPSETQRKEETGFAAAFRMPGIHQVIDNLVSLNQPPFHIRQSHASSSPAARPARYQLF
jgi:hypothetical protein